MFFKKQITMENGFNGVVTFFNSFNAMKAEKTAKKAMLKCKLVHSPRELSPACGVALAFNYCDSDKLKLLLQEKNVSFDAIHAYPQ